MKPATVFLLAAAVATTPARAADGSLSRVTTDELRTHVETLSADSFEGREAGRRGGQAAAAYLLAELKRLDVRPAGENDTVVQEFGPGYRNLLVAILGSDERLAGEVVVVGAHYDHVGYGSKDNSFGPLGRVHNGADDNASGTAALLELAEAFAASRDRPKRTLLFAFWDAEEKGLLGSAHWVSRPTVPLESVKFAFNLDMLGRLRDRTLEVYGVRTAAGLRRLLAEGNADTDLTLKFDRAQREDSDHWSFYKKRIPYVMLHTGLHGEYHRPADDAHLINVEGLREVTEVCREAITSIADAPGWHFRDACAGEANETEDRFSVPPTRPSSRLGVSWDSTLGGRGEFVLTAVRKDSPAAKAGLRPGDRIDAINGVRPGDTGEFRRRVLTAASDTTLSVVRGESVADVRVKLDGPPVRVGMTWRHDDAEPGVAILSGVVAGAPADEAGLRPNDRVLKVNGESFTDEPDFRRRFEAAGATPELLVERDGRLRAVSLELE